MKYILAIVAALCMLGSFFVDDQQPYGIYMKVVAIALFFYVMMQLMDKTPSKSISKNDNQSQLNQTNDEKMD